MKHLSPDQFANTLKRFVTRSAYTPSQLSRLSGLPKNSIVNWLNGRVVRPRTWVGLVQLAAALRLTEPEANALLAAAQYPPLADLRHQHDEPHQPNLFHFWQMDTPAPFQAIPLPPHFVGRENEQQAIAQAILQQQETHLCWLHGMAGVGKTALAAHLAYQLRPHFPDGVLWARLDTSDTLAILATFAEAYGQDVSCYRDVASRSRVVRNLLAHKKVLLILDNAEASDQVTPLLPPTGQAVVLVTSRLPTAGLGVKGQRFEIRPFAATESASTTAEALFAQLLGEDYTRTHAPDIHQIAQHLGQLPLALVIAASRLAHEPLWDTAAFLQRIRNAPQRLDTLHYAGHSIAPLFQASYDQLPPPAQTLLRVLGSLGQAPFALETIAALLQLSPAQAQAGLRHLFHFSLVQRAPHGRFQLHPLLHDFAHALWQQHPQTVSPVRHWAAFVSRHPHQYDTLQPEMNHMLTALKHLRPADWPEAVELVTRLVPFWLMRGEPATAEQQLHHLQTCGHGTGDPLRTAWLTAWLGQCARTRYAWEAARTHIQASLAQAETLQDAPLLAFALTEQGIWHNCQDQYEVGATYLSRALPLARTLPNPDTHLRLLEELGCVAFLQAEFEQARSYYEEGLTLLEALPAQKEQVLFRKGVGAYHCFVQNYATAQQYFADGYALAQQIGFRRGEMLLANNLGSLAYQQMAFETAEQHYQHAHTLAYQLNDARAFLFIAANWLFLAHHGRAPSTAVAHLTRYLDATQPDNWLAAQPDTLAQLHQHLVGEHLPARVRIFV